MAGKRSSVLSGLVLAVAWGCAGPAAPPAAAPAEGPRPVGLTDGVVLFEGEAPTVVTVVGRAGTCAGATVARVEGGATLRADCQGEIALTGDAPNARLVPLESVPLRGGGGTAWTGEGWNVTLVYGPEEEGCPGLPGHVQVKRGAEPRLRQNTWLHVERAAIVETGARAWLVLEAADQGEAYALDLTAERVAWTRPGSPPAACP